MLLVVCVDGADNACGIVIKAGEGNDAMPLSDMEDSAGAVFPLRVRVRSANSDIIPDPCQLFFLKVLQNLQQSREKQTMRSSQISSSPLDSLVYFVLLAPLAPLQQQLPL